MRPVDKGIKRTRSLNCVHSTLHLYSWFPAHGFIWQPLGFFFFGTEHQSMITDLR